MPVKVTTEELEHCEVLLTVEIEPQQEQKMLEKAAKHIAREVRIPGFRPGKAPYNVVVRRFGMEAIQQQALEQTADTMVQDALKEANVEPFAQIELESVAWNPLTVKVKVPIRPKVELNDYREIRLEPEPVEVTAEDIAQALADLQEKTAAWNPVERPSAIGDLILASVVEKDGETILAKQESVEYELSTPTEHEGHNHPDFTTPLLGLSAGDEKTYTLTFSEGYGDSRYAGKEITVEVEVLSVKEKEVDDLDDEFAQAVSNFETLDELKEEIAKTLRARREDQKNLELGDKVLKQIIEASTIEWPQAYEEESVKQEIEAQERHIKSYGLGLDNYLQIQQKTKDEFVEEIRKDVVSRLKRGLVLGKIAEQEKLDISESEILDRAKFIADVSGGGDQVWRNILASETRQNVIANDLLVAKTLKWLAAIAKGQEPTVEDETDTTATTADEEPAVAELETDINNDASPEDAQDTTQEEPVESQA